MKKNISLIMALLIIASSIMVSCSDSSDDSLGNDSSAQSQSENNGTEQTTQIETEEEIPELPEKKFDGRTFTIFQCTHLASEHYAPEENGDVLNDAIYNRNLSIEEKYDIKFNYLDTAYGSYANEVRSSVLADDKLYDMLSGHAVFSAQLIPENIYMNLKDVPYLNEGLEYPWWNQNVVNDLSINNKIMMIAGDIS